MRRIAFLLCLAVPAAAFALTFEDRTQQYTDAPFNSAETAGISVLTELGAVDGYPDGSFRPNRSLNRAEYLKIVLPVEAVSDADATDCFPDVHTEDWFSRYVCYAKAQGIVSGYPDGMFHPENPVIYAEALKMLGELHNLRLSWDDFPPQSPDFKREHWYLPYYEAATQSGVALPGGVLVAHQMTRGEMARLTAAYYASNIGQLEAYRAMERGSFPRSSASSLTSLTSLTSSTSSTSSATFSPSSISSSSTSSIQRFLYPSTSHFLILGKRTPTITSGIFAFDDISDVRIVTVELMREIRSIGNLYLVDSTGRTLATLTLDKTDATRRRYRGEVAAGQSLVSKGNIPLGIEAQMKSNVGGGFPEEFIQVKSLSIIAGKPNTVDTKEVPPLEWSHPPHQTAVAVIDAVENAGLNRGTLTLGENQSLATFRFLAGSGAEMAVEQLTLTPKIAPGVSVAAWRVRTSVGGDEASCSIGSDRLVSCPIPSSIGAIRGGALTLTVLGNVSLTPGTQGATLQVILDWPGSTSTLGAVQWTDGTGHYRWLEGESPLVEGTGWSG